MVANDERRDVARRLRGARYGWHSWERALYDALGVNTETAGLDMLGRLSDLIEPEPERTCRDTSPLVYKFTCSECHSSYRFGCEHGVWYCPFCGAKVVGND